MDVSRRTLLLSLVLSATLALFACGPADDPGMPGDELIDEEGWQLNDDADRTGGRRACATCGAGVTPATPSFGSSIDAYASYVGQSTCDPTAKPGVTAFKNLILATYPCTKSGGITRSCSVGGKSEHKEGRAWDWMLNYPHPAATSLIGWLLATDANGNKHAMARRVGIMYMIWNKQIWRAYKPDSGWSTYTGSNPHTDHIHFSFSWNGAKKTTSFWSAPPPPPNKAPTGKLESAACGGISGWAQDPDVPAQAISVVLTFDAGQATSSSVTVQASAHRADLCQSLTSCNHGFSMAVPAALRDGKPHQVQAQAQDSSDSSKVELGGSPLTFTCTAPAPGQDAMLPAPDSGPGLEADGSAASQADGGSPLPPWSQPAGADLILAGGCSLAGPMAWPAPGELPLALLVLAFFAALAAPLLLRGRVRRSG